MKKHLNNKGYMLVEIILASALAMGVAFFITELTIKLKNKNDDLLVKTLVATDQAIIYNAIMKDIYDETKTFSCNNIQIVNNKFTYNGFTNVVTEYANVTYDKNKDCTYNGDTINLTIKIDVPQLTKENFDVVIKAKKL